MKIRTKIMLPLIGLLLVLIATFAYLILSVRDAVMVVREKAQKATEVNDLSTRLLILRQSSERNVLSYRFSKDKRNITNIQENRTKSDEILNRLSQIIQTETGKELLDAITDTRNNIDKSRNDLIKAIDNGDERTIRQFFDVWEINASSGLASIHDFTNYNVQVLDTVANEYERLVRHMYTTLLALSIFSAGVISALFVFLRKIITKPIEKLAALTDHISNGQFNIPFTVHSDDELGRLSKNISEMSVKLKEHYDHLKAEVKQKELEIARHKEFQAQKDDFMSIASHELKTPITSLKVFEQLLIKSVKKNGHEEYRRYLDKMDQQINKISSLISSLLDVTKIQAGKLPLTISKFDINECLKDSIETANLTSNQSIKLVGKIKKTIYADIDRISQVIDNLLSNALKYSPENSTVTITAVNHKDNFEIRVSDEGIGIDKKHQKKIFERFFRVIENDGKRFPGLGIGLYFSSDVIARHGGSMNVESEKGKGATFSFALPYDCRPVTQISKKNK